MEARERAEEILSLAEEVVRLSRGTLLAHLRFMDAALSAVRPIAADLPSGGACLASDGRFVLFEPAAVLRRYSLEKNGVTRDLLHAVMHCVFLHPFAGTLLDSEKWDLACDVAAEAAILSLDARDARIAEDELRASEIGRLREAAGAVTAEKIYRHLLDHPPAPEEFERLKALFFRDDHFLWYLAPARRAETVRRLSKEPEKDGEREKEAAGRLPESRDHGDRKAREAGEDDGGTPEETAGEQSDETEEIWSEISRRMQTEMETFAKARGDSAGSLMQNLRAVNREKYDYGEFLRKFAVMGEIMRIDPDEFDYVYYTYGLRLYGNLPLIEPLEYRETKRIREFAIAIDTSGSVSGELVETFVRKTYDVLMSTESFFSRINVHIIQCDQKIQEDLKITDRESFERCISGLTLRGFGGTDFRPVFSYVQDLVDKGEFTDLKGLIYFTDGHGIYPERMPSFETAFVFVEEGYDPPEVPPWAIRLVLDREGIRQGANALN